MLKIFDPFNRSSKTESLSDVQTEMFEYSKTGLPYDIQTGLFEYKKDEHTHLIEWGIQYDCLYDQDGKLHWGYKPYIEVLNSELSRGNDSLVLTVESIFPYEAKLLPIDIGHSFIISLYSKMQACADLAPSAIRIQRVEEDESYGSVADLIDLIDSGQLAPSSVVELPPEYNQDPLKDIAGKTIDEILEGVNLRSFRSSGHQYNNMP